MQITWLNRHNTCEMNGRCLEFGNRLHRDAGPYACFHAAFAFINEHYTKTFNIKYNLHMKKACDGSRNNFVILSKVDMCRLLNSMKQLIPFKFHFSKSKLGESYMTLNLELEGTGMQHKGLLMLCRMLFEYPHNMCASDALKLREIGILDGNDISKLPLVTLYLLCISSMYFSVDECFIGIHNPDIPSFSELRKKLKIRTRKRISRIITSKNYRAEIRQKPTTLEEVLSEEGFNKRLEVYTRNIIKNLNA